MPNFVDVKAKVDVWIPVDRITLMEGAPGGLTTVVHCVLLGPQGPAVGRFEVEGRCRALGAAIDSGKPTEVGQ